MAEETQEVRDPEPEGTPPDPPAGAPLPVRTTGQGAQARGERVYTEAEYRAAVQEAAKKPQSQVEKLQKEHEKLAREIRTANAVGAAARKGARYPDVIAALVPADAADLDQAVEDLKVKYPAYFHPGGGDGGGGGNGGAPASQAQDHGDDMNARLRAATGRA